MTNTFRTVVYTLFMMSSLAARKIRPRVIGGKEDIGREFPFAVMIQDAKPPMLRRCTGSLIASTWVLTAAHCFNPQNVMDKRRVKYGDQTMPSNETKFFAKIIKGTHPNYNAKIETNDIGLLKTERIPYSPLVKLSAVDYAAFMGLPVKYAGFGRTKLLLPKQKLNIVDLEQDLDPPLIVGEAVVISCRQDGRFGSGRPGICLAPRCGPRQHPYFGDSGGPLLLYGRVIGVASGFRELDPPIISYTPVSPYLKWIHDMIHSDLKDDVIS